MNERPAALVFLPEADVLARWPVLSAGELKRARKANPPAISFYDFPKRQGGPCYTVEQVQEYIDRVYLRGPECRAEPPVRPSLSDSKSETITSTGPIPNTAATGTPAGMTPALMQSAAEALAQQISKPRRSSSPPSSRPPRKRSGKVRLALVKS